MIHGLIWLPLLAIFIGLAWAGWNEYQKLEAYRAWAETCDRAKYDIYAVLGQRGDQLIWGKPTRQGPVELTSLSLNQVQTLQVVADRQPIDLANPPANPRQVALELQPQTSAPVQIPFTDVAIAIQWARALQQDLQRVQARQT
ncbi:MAG: hypothetical protein VKK04_05870 [Synechococcales bacterium]|nr:hypothetical protein [Synechococcales bacterium]